MTSIFNGRWPEMSSFNIFIKTSHFDHFFFLFLVSNKQTNLCNSPKYSFSLQRLKYININSTECIRKKKEGTHTRTHTHTHTHTHTCHEHAQNTQVRTWYTERNISHWHKGGIIILISRNFCTVLLATHKKIHSFKERHVFLWNSQWIM